MGRRSHTKKTFKPSVRKQPSPVITSQPSAVGTIGQGISLGAGAAIGSTMVHGAMDALSGNKQEENVKKYDCDNLLEQFKECSKNYEDLNTCKPFLHFYTSCINPNSSLQHPY